MQRLATIFVLIVALFLSPPIRRTLAGSFEEATRAYEHGDYQEAYRLFKPLAEQGNATAQYNLGVMYYYGQGVPENCAETVNWYRKAADQGLAVAQYNLGRMYERGRGVPHDDAEAVKWYRKAAEQGDGNAQYSLGAMYSRGQGVARDYVFAYMWFDLAASSDPNPEDRALAVHNRDIVASVMTPAQIAEAQRLGRQW